jgi:excisionase family DNA binding protein
MDRLTVAEAAERLGVTQDAVRQRVRRDTIEHERTEDGRVYVYLTEEDARGDAVPYAVQKAMVEELRDRIRYLEEESRRKDHLLAAALERIPPAIEAPPEPRESPENFGASVGSTPPPPEQQEETSRPQERRWWRRMFGA